MYTMTREPSGAVNFRTHGPPGELTAAEALRALIALRPVLAELRGRALTQKDVPRPPAGDAWGWDLEEEVSAEEGRTALPG